MGHRATAIAVIALAADIVALLALLTPPTELTRFRNSLLASVAAPSDLSWTPDVLPEAYRPERGAPPEEFVLAVENEISHRGDAVTLMSELVEHLHPKPKRRGPIKSTTVQAYREIRASGRGYCADYTQVFNGLTYTASLPVREWGLSFDRFSGDGHAFSEVYDREAGQWIFVDPMNSFYVRDAAGGKPLSVLEFRERLLDESGYESVSIVPIGEHFLFSSGREAFDYYEEGADQFFLWFGNDVFTYDSSAVVGMLGWSRPLEQLAAIPLGIHPEIRILETPSNRDEIDALLRLRDEVIALTAIAFMLALFVAVRFTRSYRRRQRSAQISSSMADSR